MVKEIYKTFESYMLACMGDCAHDKEHVYRVLYIALDIAQYEENVNKDNLIISCLLHDIGRNEQFQNPTKCHAQVGSQLAYEFCIGHDISRDDALHIMACISTHRFRGDNPPQSIEAKILFDADKIDATGVMGIARTLFYKGIVNEPLYRTDKQGHILDGTTDNQSSFLQEYHYKLKNLYDKFYTKRGKQIACERRQAAVSFYENMLSELTATYKMGQHLLI